MKLRFCVTRGKRGVTYNLRKQFAENWDILFQNGIKTAKIQYEYLICENVLFSCL